MEETNTSLDNYRPLIVIVVIITLASASLYVGSKEIHDNGFMSYFMGMFFLIFSMFKLFDLKGFVAGFRMYDLIGKRIKEYAYTYPFIELVLGLIFLSSYLHCFANLITLVVMTVSAIGVISSIANGMNVKCACLGTVLSVPLSTVSIIENVGMALMALGTLVLNYS